jgi:hypothetical protein
MAQVKQACGQGRWPSPQNVLIPLTTEFTSQVKKNNESEQKLNATV